MNCLRSLMVLVLAVAFMCGNGHAQTRKAPEWVISEWINGSGVRAAELRGKVVIVEFFQLWCPGCKGFSIPLMKQWRNTFKDEIEGGRLALLSIHTVFEGHEYQTPQRLRQFVKEQNIRHLVGIDVQKSGERLPETMKRYRTKGTPEIAVIDKKGNIRIQIFGGFHTGPVEKKIRELLKE